MQNQNRLDEEGNTLGAALTRAAHVPCIRGYSSVN